MNEFYSILKYLSFQFFKVYGTERCQVCNEKIRCRTNQFIKGDKNKVQCIHCERHLETIRER